MITNNITFFILIITPEGIKDMPAAYFCHGRKRKTDQYHIIV